MNLFKIESPFRRSKKSQDPTEKTRAIAERLYRNRQVMKHSGSAEGDWAKAERILKSPIRRVLFRLNQSLIRAEKGAVEPFANWIERADLFRIVERLSPTIEALGVVAIPLVLFFAAQSYQTNLLRRQAVMDYLNQLSTILLDVEGNLRDPKNVRIRTLVTATTLTLLRDPNLDGDNKGQVIEFLSQMNLVQSEIVYGPQRPEEDGVAVISLRHADLSSANLSYTDLSRIDFSYADLNDANLIGADLVGARLEGYLNRADLRYADLRYATVRTAYFNHADLSHADFSHANLGLLVLHRANLHHTDLRYVDLRHVSGLTQSQLETGYLCKTRLPAGMDLDPDRNCE